MKNFINYYYNMNIPNIHQKGKNYYFKVNDDIYSFIVCYENKDLNDIYQLNNYLNQLKIKFHQIIININNEIITKINDNNYILLKLSKTEKNINLNEIININNINVPLNKLRRTNWSEMWSEKLDYFEYQISQIGKKYPLIRESFNYYLGLGELAISIVNNTEKDKLYLSLSHRRINDLYNPLNLIIDFRIRDVCEYFKLKFFENNDIIAELDSFLFNNNLTNNEKKLFIARMLFPTYYFDMYEKIINNETKEEDIKKIIVKVNEYEKIILKIYIHFKFNNNLHIDWLENINQY